LTLLASRGLRLRVCSPAIICNCSQPYSIETDTEDTPAQPAEIFKAEQTIMRVVTDHSKYQHDFLYYRISKIISNISILSLRRFFCLILIHLYIFAKSIFVERVKMGKTAMHFLIQNLDFP
jgi:hypothetical protein